jgi:tRNA modification GTPase
MLRFGRFVDRAGQPLDQVTMVFMPRGKSYTGLDQFEIYCHGGRHVVRRLLDELTAFGARPAEPGEFTRLAFLNGRIDLTRAEAVAEIIAANTEVSFQASREHLLGKYAEKVNALREKLVDILAEIEASIDFAEEDIDPKESERLEGPMGDLIKEISDLAATYRGGRIINEGFRVAICGRPNAGKSSLFNLLLREERALVNPTAGTTRDYLSEWIDLEGFAVNLIDTAGLRQGGSMVEKAGQSRAQKIMKESDLVIWIADMSSRSWKSRLKTDIPTIDNKNILLVANKIDIIGTSIDKVHDFSLDLMPVSCTLGTGIEDLKSELVRRINESMPDLTSGLVVTSARHRQKLSEASRDLKAALRKIKQGETAELVAFDLREARQALDEITGRVYTEEILGQIFVNFCVGK